MNPAMCLLIAIAAVFPCTTRAQQTTVDTLSATAYREDFTHALEFVRDTYAYVATTQG